MNRSIRKTLSVVALCGVVTSLTESGRAEYPGKYLGPCDVVASSDAGSLLVLNADAGQVAVVDVGGRVTGTIDMPATPTGLVLSPDGATLYVTCARPEGTVAVVDVPSGKVTATIPVGHTPIGPAVSRDGKRLYVCNRFAGDVSVIDVRMTHDVESRRPFDRRSDFDTPTLIEVWRTAPYMHDGQYTTIKELIVEGKHGNRSGSLDQLDDREIDDLVEFVLSL